MKNLVQQFIWVCNWEWFPSKRGRIAFKKKSQQRWIRWSILRVSSIDVPRRCLNFMSGNQIGISLQSPVIGRSQKKGVWSCVETVLSTQQCFIGMMTAMVHGHSAEATSLMSGKWVPRSLERPSWGCTAASTRLSWAGDTKAKHPSPTVQAGIELNTQRSIRLSLGRKRGNECIFIGGSWVGEI